MPAAAGAGNSDRGACNVSSTVPRGGEQHANGRFVVGHPRCGARNNIGNTIGTSRAGPRDESNLGAAIPTAIAKRSLQNN